MMWTKCLAAMLAVLTIVPAVIAQEPPSAAAAERAKEKDLLPPPPVSFFQGRPIYRIGEEEVKPPEVVSAPDPPPLHDFAAGKVVLWCVVGKEDGKAHLIKVAKRWNMEAEMKARQNLEQWKFKPGKKKNDEIDVMMIVEIVWK